MKLASSSILHRIKHTIEPFNGRKGAPRRVARRWRSHAGARQNRPGRCSSSFHAVESFHVGFFHAILAPYHTALGLSETKKWSLDRRALASIVCLSIPRKDVVLLVISRPSLSILSRLSISRIHEERISQLSFNYSDSLNLGHGLPHLSIAQNCYDFCKFTVASSLFGLASSSSNERHHSPGATMTTKEKLDIARQLAKLGVDIIEAGFPASSKADLEAVKLIAQEVGNVGADGHVPVICGLARCNKNDSDKSWEAVKHAKFPRIHTFIATSEIHMQYKLKMSKEQVIEKARSMVAYARSLGCNDVEFSPEDAGRSEREFLYEILGEVIKAGATTLNIPDTVGYNWPREFGQLIADIKANTPGIENVIISTHCQNDLGLSTANTLEGAYNGARQLEVTINGIGERAGNASLEEVVMTIKCKGELLGGLHTGINTRHIVMASKMFRYRIRGGYGYGAGTLPKRSGEVSKLKGTFLGRSGEVSYAFLCVSDLKDTLSRNKLTPSRAQDLVYIHNNLRLLSRTPNDDVNMWDVGGDAFDSMEDVGFLEVEEYSGLMVQPHKAIVGANAFAHESGIHQVTKTYI
ncbi:hypothetical protein LXL04_023179 [Taraxacum kok-saghyz]